GPASTACQRPASASKTLTPSCATHRDACSASSNRPAATPPRRFRAFTNTASHTNFPTNCGELMPASVTKVRAPDEHAIEAMLDHVARYRLTTFAVAARLPKFNGIGRGGLRRLLRQCGKAGLLSSTLLHAGVRYWFLTERGARRQQLDVSR